MIWNVHQDELHYLTSTLQVFNVSPMQTYFQHSQAYLFEIPQLYKGSTEMHRLHAIDELWP